MTPENPVVHLEEADRPALQAHLLALGREDRRLRFGAAIGDAGLRAYAARIDFEEDGLFAVRADDLPIALVHVAFTDTKAELGLSVLLGWRGRGLGNRLFERAVAFLHERGATEVVVHCRSENGAMMHLARKHGMRIVDFGQDSDGRLGLAKLRPLAARVP